MKKARRPFALAFILILSIQTLHGGSATWSANAVSGDWNTAPNWIPPVVPNSAQSSATFAVSTTTGISISANTQVSTIAFNAGASNFTITANPGLSLTIGGGGITNNSGVTQNFMTAVSAASGLRGFLVFANNATVGSGIALTNKAGPSSGETDFLGSSSAGSATITDNGGSGNGPNGGITHFFNTSTAGNAMITNNPATAAQAFTGLAQFSDTSTAGNARITNQGGAVSGGTEGETRFSDSSTAATASIINQGGIVNLASGGLTDFNNMSSAANTIINNNGGAVKGAYGGTTVFGNNSTAAAATFINDGDVVTGAGPGSTQFFDFSTAGNGTFTNNAGTSTRSAVTYFANSSTAENGVITNNGAAVGGAVGGRTILANTSTAGNALITNNASTTSEAGGGTTFFADDSSGGTAQIGILGNGTLDITAHNPPGVTIGSLEGSGTVLLGANNLTVGSNNLSTMFSGTIQDDGANGSFTKIGSGILTIEGGTSNDHISDTVTLTIANGSVVNLNFTGTADRIAGLIANGVAQPAGFYGSVASGAPHPLPVFAGTGLIQVLPLAPPMIISPLNVSVFVGQPFVYQIEAPGATAFDTGSLPPGLNLLSFPQSAIAGIPDTTGVFQLPIFASNSFGTTQATLFIDVQQVPTAGPIIISGNAATGRVGQPFTFRVFTRGGTPAETLTATGLPPGLALDAVPGIHGLISGTPTTEGSFAVGLTVTDGSFTTTSTLQLTFTADPARPVIVSPSTVTLIAGQFFTYTIDAPSSADPSDPTFFSYVGDLPAGLNFDAATGTISGIYTPFLQRSNKPSGPPKPDLAGGVLLGSIQLFATNGHGSSTIELIFLRPSSGVVNISTRLLVGTSDNVLIGGFIITGNAPEVLVIRAIGPSLPGLPDLLQDPVLELHDAANHVVSNDNWRDSQQDLLNATTIPPADNRESAILIGLDPGNYTAIVAGKNGTTGTALVEAYDLGTGSLDVSGAAKLANISTRGFVNLGNDVMIGGFIVLGQTTRVIARAIGPSLTAYGIQGALQDTVLELRDNSGSLILANDDWRSTQEAEIIATGIPPADDRESAVVENLAPGNYTAIVRGKNDTTGVALVEVYSLQ